jgi:hypothetical protein
MTHFVRLQLIGRVTYYAGWIALLCGGLVHFNFAREVFVVLSINKRNLFEISVMCFLVCMASELRALSLVRNQGVTEMPNIVKRQAAA